MMKKYVIIADGTCDLNEDMLREYDIKPVLGHIHLPDGSEISQFLSWKDYTREDFYNKLKKNPNGYSTSPANPEMFAAVYREYAKQGVDMLVLTMSAGMSGTYNFACAGREAGLHSSPHGSRKTSAATIRRAGSTTSPSSPKRAGSTMPRRSWAPSSASSRSASLTTTA